MSRPIEELHPAVSFLYLLAALCFTMLFNHPVFLGVSLAGGLLAALLAGGGLKSLLISLPLMLGTALLNPIFSHEGVTILCYLPWGNPLTLESILYGCSSGAMLAAAVSWFSCMNRVITSEKLIYLFGRVAPSLSLLLSMTLRFVPRFTSRVRSLSGWYPDEKTTLIRRFRRSVDRLSAATTWALESAVDSADSMRSRGYGLPGRSSFGIFRFTRRDRNCLVLLLTLIAAVAAGGIAGLLNWRYYPVLTGQQTPGTWVVCGCYLLFCCFPHILSGLEAAKWRK